VTDAGRDGEPVPRAERDPPPPEPERERPLDDLDAQLLTGVFVRAEAAAAGAEVRLDHDRLAAGARRGAAEDDPLPRLGVLDALTDVDTEKIAPAA
jgi:hypothetical protein